MTRKNDESTYTTRKFTELVKEFNRIEDLPQNLSTLWIDDEINKEYSTLESKSLIHHVLEKNKEKFEINRTDIDDDEKLFHQFLQYDGKINFSSRWDINTIVSTMTLNHILISDFDDTDKSNRSFKIQNKEKILAIMEHFNFLHALKMIGINIDYELFLEIRTMDYKLLLKFNKMISTLKITSDTKSEYIMAVSNLIENWVMDKRLSCFMKKTLD